MGKQLLALCLFLYLNTPVFAQDALKRVFRCHIASDNSDILFGESEYTDGQINSFGWKNKTLVCWDFGQPGPGRVAVYGWYNPVSRDHFSAAEDKYTDDQLLQMGYTQKHLQFYGLSQDNPGKTAAMYEWYSATTRKHIIVTENEFTDDEMMRKGFGAKKFICYVIPGDFEGFGDYYRKKMAGSTTSSQPSSAQQYTQQPAASSAAASHYSAPAHSAVTGKSDRPTKKDALDFLRIKIVSMYWGGSFSQKKLQDCEYDEQACTLTINEFYDDKSADGTTIRLKTTIYLENLDANTITWKKAGYSGDGTGVNIHAKANKNAGFVSGGKAGDAGNYLDLYIWFDTRQTKQDPDFKQRIQKALTTAIIYCGGDFKEEKF